MIEGNIHIVSLRIRATLCGSFITDALVPEIMSFVKRHKNIVQLLLCGNRNTTVSAQPLIDMIQSCEHLRSFCVCTTPCIEEPEIEFLLCQAIEQNKDLSNSMTVSKLENSWEGFTLPKAPTSRQTLLPYALHSPRQFNQFFCVPTADSNSSLPLARYSKLVECDYRAETARLVQFIDHRKLVENFVEDFFETIINDNETPVKILSIGSGTLFAEAMLVAKNDAASQVYQTLRC